MKSDPMKIGILQCGHLEKSLKEKHGDFDFMFANLLSGYGFEFENYVVVDNQFPDSVDECEGWLVTGSVHGAYDALEWIAPLEQFIRDCYAKNIPVIGICFGHQVMAQAFGGKVEKYSGGWGIGHTQYSITHDEPSGDDNYADLLACHQDQVVEVPVEARVIASTEFCANAGFAYKGSAMSFQPHPEFTPEFMRDLVRYKITQGLDPQVGEAAIGRVEDQNDSKKIANQIAQFYLAARKSALSEQAA